MIPGPSDVDLRALALVQAGYLRLLDLTGVFVGTLIMGLSAAACCGFAASPTTGGAALFVIVPVLGLLSVEAFVLYILQKRDRQALFNQIAAKWAGDPDRRLSAAVFTLSSAFFFAARDPGLGIAFLALTVLVYLRAVRIRDREPGTRREVPAPQAV